MGVSTLKEWMLLVQRPKRKVILIVITLLWACISVILFQTYTSRSDFKQVEGKTYDGKVEGTPSAEEEAKAYSKVKEILLDDLTIKLFARQNRIVDSRTIESHSSIYDQIFAHHGVNSVLGGLDFSERCDLYFTTLFTDKPNWMLDPNEKLPLDGRYEYTWESYRHHNSNKLKEEIAKEKDIDKSEVKEDEDFNLRLTRNYENFWAKTQNIEQKVVDMLSHLRIFNKCYVSRDNQQDYKSDQDFIKDQHHFVGTLDLVYSQPESSSLKFAATEKEKLLNSDSFKECSNMEGRVYPWLTGQYPIYERWTKEVVASPPQLKKYHLPSVVFEPSNKAAHDGKGNGGKVKSKLTNNNHNCFLSGFKNKLNGKGIVLSISDHHVDDTVRLIHLLRGLNNRYPIQIVYTDGISEESKARIITSAQELYITLPESYQKVKGYFPADYFNAKHGLPKQEVWFVNVNKAINEQYKEKFKGFGNKFLAAMFNSFEEYMLVDADTVVVQNPDYFFKMKNYVSKGAYFYKDRTAAEFRPDSDCAFFKKITPSPLDQIVFDIPTILPESFTKNEFFNGMNYYMESGLVMINRNMHFSAVMMMLQMNFLQPVTERVYGDKEIFFLGFLAAGDENYHFNELPAAAIGKESPRDEMFLNKDLVPQKAREICAAHPGHIDGADSKTLVWFNSGFQFCGQTHKVNYENEFKEGRRFKFLENKEDMEKFYKDPLRMTHAVIPPFKNKWETLGDNIIGEPLQSWKCDDVYCGRYLWCAYNRIGGTQEDGTDNTQYGTFIDFDQKSIDLFHYYGDIWVGSE